MENNDRLALTRWVEERIAALDPPEDWDPDRASARARLEARLHGRSAAGRYWLAGSAAAALVLAGVLISPAGRAFAQQIWQRFAVGRIEVVRVDFDSLPDEARSLTAQPIEKPGPAKIVNTPAEAAALAGFTPRLPQPDRLAGTPQLSVLGPMSFGTTIKAADLELALRKGGVSDQPVPPEWDGAQIAVRIGATVNAAWSGDVGLMQGLPPVFSMPPGFDLGAFTSAVLRGAGMNRKAAGQLGRRMATAPAMLLGIGGAEKAAIRDVTLHTGPATVIEDFDDRGQPERVAVIWSVPDRIYLLTGALTVEQAIAVADSID